MPRPSSARRHVRLPGRVRIIFSQRALLQPALPLRVMSLLALLLLASLASTPIAQADEASQSAGIRIERQGDRFIVQGLARPALQELRESDSQSWADLLTVSVAQPDEQAADPLPPVLGTREVTDDALQFNCRFPLRPGLRYAVQLNVSQLPGYAGDLPPIRELFKVPDEPAEDKAATTLTGIYPSSDVLPENQLKFYLHFSRPMSRGHAYRHVRLLTAEGEPVEYPFLELGEELWDPEFRRFTLFFDPGRIKRGLKPREQFGPSLIEGHKYVLEIDAQWEDAEGRPLAGPVRKAFRAVAPDDTQPDPARWTLSPPESPQDWLTVEFDEPLDHGMLQRVVRVLDAAGDRVPGEVMVDRQETRWRFRPSQPWAAGEYFLSAASNLEDRAGNSIARPFEVDLFDTVQRRIEVPDIRLPFQVR